MVADGLFTFKVQRARYTREKSLYYSSSLIQSIHLIHPRWAAVENMVVFKMLSP